MSMSQVVQQQSVFFGGSLNVLKHLLFQLAGAVQSIDDKRMKVFGCVDLVLENKIATLEVS